MSDYDYGYQVKEQVGVQKVKLDFAQPPVGEVQLDWNQPQIEEVAQVMKLDRIDVAEPRVL